MCGKQTRLTSGGVRCDGSHIFYPYYDSNLILSVCLLACLHAQRWQNSLNNIVKVRFSIERQGVTCQLSWQSCQRHFPPCGGPSCLRVTCSDHPAARLSLPLGDGTLSFATVKNWQEMEAAKRDFQPPIVSIRSSNETRSKPQRQRACFRMKETCKALPLQRIIVVLQRQPVPFRVMKFYLNGRCKRL